MPSPPCLDIAHLLAPLPGPDPAGHAVSLTVRQKLDALRKEFEINPDNPSLPPVPKKPDWPGIRRLAEEILTGAAKDLEVSLRLIEAVVKLHGFAGLRDGLRLLREMAEQCWDVVHPIPEEGEGMEARSARYAWLTESDRGARFPNTVRGIAALQVKGQPLSLLDVQLSMRGQGPVAAAALETAEPVDAVVADDFAQCVEELNLLEAVLGPKCAPDPPAWSGLHQAMDEWKGYLRKAIPQPVAEVPGSANGPGPGTAFSSNGPILAIASREEAYRQLAQIANTLEQLEPHSPIPDLLRRAIELGKMPFRQLVQELVRDSSQLAEVQREYGLKLKESESSFQ